jgi:subtilisin-like proprotein convertase family protein
VALAAAVLSVVGSAAALASVAAQAPESAEISLAVPGGSAMFLVESPDAAQSPALRINTDRADKQGNIPEPTPGYTVFNRVIVQTDDAAALANAVGQVTTKLRGEGAITVNSVAAHESVSGFVIVETASVAQAAALASQLSGQYASVELDIEQPRTLRSLPNDATFNLQWHLLNTSLPIADVNAEGAWALGYTGAGVTIGILEGGIQSNHPDLAANYNAAASQTGGSATSHGTSCAGIAAAVGNNSIGVAGLAYAAQVSQQIYGSSTQTANGFKFRNDLNDVKSNSWGPADNGTITYLSTVERVAIEQTVNDGRGGLGTILCWAAGNGGTGDRVEYDPYASNRRVLAIGGVGDLDRRSSFNELGSSMLVVTHTSGNTRGTRTTNSGSGYTSNFGGTSSASPLAAGAVGLALEANPDLTWRDVMHVLIESARKVDPTNSLWTTNAAGYDINYNYGFGAIDAEQLVLTAASWTNVAPEVSATSGVQTVGVAVPDNNTTGVTQTVNIAEDIKIEAVELVLNLTTTYVGDYQVTLTSPQGTESILAVRRNDSNDNYTNYIFTSHRPFGESSAGDWTVRVQDLASGDPGTWVNYTVNVYGTENNTVEPCGPADLNGDGVLDFGDVGAFVDLFAASDLGADLNDDGVLDFGDVGQFVTLFGAGC